MEVLSDLRIPEAPLDKVRVCGGPSSAREETNDGGEKVGRGRRGGGWCDGLDLWIINIDGGPCYFDENVWLSQNAETDV